VFVAQIVTKGSEKMIVGCARTSHPNCYFELLGIHETINANVYSQQLQRLNEVLLQKRTVLANQKGVILLHDNSRPHVAKLTQQKIEQLGRKVLAHPS
jgi:histone-lysine N-methyltransferase SETMAR